MQVLRATPQLSSAKCLGQRHGRCKYSGGCQWIGEFPGFEKVIVFVFPNLLNPLTFEYN